MYPQPIQDLIRAFSRLPTVGQRTAERFVFHLLKSGKKEVAELTIALKTLIETVKSCEYCWDFSDQSPCAICQDGTRDQYVLCVVATPQDVQAIEQAGVYTGLYHVLRGTIKSDDEKSIARIKVVQLLERLKTSEFKEVVLALNPDLPGETTMMFLERKLQAQFPDIRVSRLARGLPMGSDLQYADDITLGSAFTHRTTRDKS